MSIETYKIIQNCQNFHEDRRSSRSTNMFTLTHTNNKRVFFNWIEFSAIFFLYKCAARLHEVNRDSRDSSIRYTTLLFQKNTTHKKTLRYWYYCQLYYSLHVILGRMYLLAIKGIWSYIHKICKSIYSSNIDLMCMNFNLTQITKLGS